MRVKTELAAVILLAAVGASLAAGLLLGVVATKATAPAPERAPACPCTPSTITT